MIVPVLNDTAALARLLDAIGAWRGRPVEIVVVAGAPDPELAQLCRAGGIRCVEGPRNRGEQLDIGARETSAPVLWFVHADAELPPDALAHVTAAIDSGAESGCFAFAFQGPRTGTKALLERLVGLRIRLGGVAYGDQALFATREAYRACSGFSHQPLFEEVRLVRRLRRRGTFRALPQRVRVSARRWERDGWWRRTFHNRWLAICYMLGISAERLAGAYGQSKKAEPKDTAEADRSGPMT
jgi:rSAM/selenodomain-associated transferase 2